MGEKKGGQEVKRAKALHCNTVCLSVFLSVCLSVSYINTAMYLEVSAVLDLNH